MPIAESILFGIDGLTVGSPGASDGILVESPIRAFPNREPGDDVATASEFEVQRF